jgi:hypothetical protein
MWHKLVLFNQHRTIPRIGHKHKFIGGALYNKQKRFTQQQHGAQVQHKNLSVTPARKPKLSLKL